MLIGETAGGPLPPSATMKNVSIQGKDHKVVAAQEKMVFTFRTNGGPQVVEITDEKVANFIEETRYFECYGENPAHPIDFCQIAYQLYLDDEISEEDYHFYYEKFVEIMKNFKYE